MTSLILPGVAAAFLAFGALLSTASIYRMLALRAEERRQHRELLRLEAQANRRFKHRSPAGRAHAATY
jgi:hypothetical protein